MSPLPRISLDFGFEAILETERLKVHQLVPHLKIPLNHAYLNDSRNNRNYDIDYCKAQDDKGNWQRALRNPFVH